MPRNGQLSRFTHTVVLDSRSHMQSTTPPRAYASLVPGGNVEVAVLTLVARDSASVYSCKSTSRSLEDARGAIARRPVLCSRTANRDADELKYVSRATLQAPLNRQTSGADSMSMMCLKMSSGMRMITQGGIALLASGPVTEPMSDDRVGGSAGHYGGRELCSCESSGDEVLATSGSDKESRSRS